LQLLLNDTLSRSKVPMVPADPRRVTIYTCGPTVYRYVHIGNLRTYLLTDILVRTLAFLGYGTFSVQNITDMGHMHQEQLELGQDKVIAAARAAGKSAREIAAFTQAYFRDIGRLGLTPADVYPRASEHVPEMISLVRAVEDRGAVYGRDGYVYFDVSKAPGYGTLSGAALGAGAPAGRTDAASHRRKKRAEDFVLWMPAEPDREFQWDSPWGRGWPGWHSECAAMALKYLGPSFDIHVGGVDLRFPHHENSRALATTATGERFAANWIHAAHLLVEGKKMSKSAGNEYTLDDLEHGPPGGPGFAPADFRYYCMTLHYATPMNFTWRGQAAAARALARLRNAFAKAVDGRTAGDDVSAELRQRFQAAVADDLNVPRAVAVVHDAVRRGIRGDVARTLAADWDRVLGIGLPGGAATLPRASGETVPRGVEELSRIRDARRKAGDFQEADVLRDRIRAMGYDVVDEGGGPAALRKRHERVGGGGM
jgi:cysteinyl-tRNA synthetase